MSKIKTTSKGIRYIKLKDAIKGYLRFIKTNHRERADCVVHAFAAVTDSNYFEAHKFCSYVLERKDRRGVFYFRKKMSLSDTVLDCNRILKKKYKVVTNHTGFKIDDKFFDPKKIPLVTRYGKTRASQMTVGTFIKHYPKGKYIISIRGHAFAILDGVVVGNTRDSHNIKCRVENAYEFY